MKKKFFGFVLVLMLVLCGTVGISVPSNLTARACAEGKTRYQASYEGSTYLGLYNETITYAYKLESNYTLSPKLPGYGSSLGCGITAGANIVAWYNKMYPQLIPGHTAGQTFLGTWIWASENPYTAALNSQLYSDMGAVGTGVTINGYLGGLNTYVTGKNKIFSKTNMMGTGGIGNVLNQNYRAALQNGQLMTVFVDGFNILDGTNIQSNSSQGYDTVLMTQFTGAHAMAAYGYREISYYNAQNVMFRQDIYLSVVTGLGGLGLTRITNQPYGTLDDIYITYIY